MSFAEIYSDSELRRSLLQILAASIRIAHDLEPGAWSVSLRDDGSYVNLIVGRIYLLSLKSDSVWVVVDGSGFSEAASVSLDESAARLQEDNFRSVPDAVSYEMPPAVAVELWPQIAPAHESVLAKAASTVSITPQWGGFSEETLRSIEEELGIELPRPSYLEPDFTFAGVDRLLSLMELRYPDWEGFRDPRFVEEEIEYKQATVDKATELLGPEVLARLIEEEDYDAFLERVEAIGQDNNLLYLSVPKSGDLSVLYYEDLDRKEFCRAFLDLVHGEGTGAERLERYLDWIAEEDIPDRHNKWTFPTYFLFICNPETEVFLKPRATRHFIDLMGLRVKLRPNPDPRVYDYLRRTFVRLGEELEEFKPRDMIDLQSLMWVTVREDQKQKEDSEEASPEMEKALVDAFASYLDDPVYAFTCELRRHRASELRELLSDTDSLDLDRFNREVWRIESETRVRGEQAENGLYGLLYDESRPSESELGDLKAALANGEIEIHGNFLWGSATHVYGPMLQKQPEAGSDLEVFVEAIRPGDPPVPLESLIREARARGWRPEGDPEEDARTLIEDHPQHFSIQGDGSVRFLTGDEARERFIREALSTLLDDSLDPLEKARSIMEVPGFGRNVATGLVMVFHPEEMGTYNRRSQAAVESMGFEAGDLDTFRASIARLRDIVDARDFIDLDFFLHQVAKGAIRVQPEDESRSTGIWWVNQGKNYEDEKEHGYVYATPRSDDGRRIPHHETVKQLQPGNVILHYVRGQLRAVGHVTDPPEEGARPAAGGAEEGGETGYQARVRYSELPEPIALDAIPAEWRTKERGPFDRKGKVNQGYLFPLSESFASQVAEKFPTVGEIMGPIPPASPDYLEPAFSTIHDIVRRKGMKIEERLLRRYHLSLKTRGFVILSGVSGTGKTWLTELYAGAVGAHYRLVAVAPNWTSNEDLLGYFNPWTETYQDTPFSRFLVDAAEEYRRAEREDREAVPFHLTLDEMNLARVEYYFARFLSALELRARGGTPTIELGPHDNVDLPPNLLFVGTVNVDETTHGFADKVFDRAQLLELEAPRELLRSHLGETPYRDLLMQAWDAVQPVAPFAYRVMDEIKTYVELAEDFGVTWEEALDEQVVQKVLPKLRGGDRAVEQVLADLLDVTAGRLPLTHEKADQMLIRFREHGFTSFF